MTTTLTLRNWQKRLLTHLDGLPEEVTTQLIVATPGGGKSIAAGQGILSMWQKRGFERIVIVVPTAKLRTQWADVMASMRVQLDPSFSNSEGIEAPDFHGLVVSYHQVAKNPELFEQQCRQRKTVVILDEIHHASDESSWGKALRTAFGEAAFVMLLSGTPFRSDDDPIPFVEYDTEGTSQADFTYGYEEAVKDSVCRPIRFVTFDGDMIWRYGEDEVYASLTETNLNSANSRRRLRAAISTDGSMLPGMILRGINELSEIRADVPDAGGLVLCDNQKNARRVAQILETLTGLEPTLVISDNYKAQDELNGYAVSESPWIVAVKMVCEGVDIPRLSVLVYATNTSTDMFLRQAAGRVLRTRGADVEGQVAVVIAPRAPELLPLFERMEKDMHHEIEIDPEDPIRRAAADQSEQLEFEVCESRVRDAVELLVLGHLHRAAPVEFPVLEDPEEPAKHRRVSQLRAMIAQLVGQVGELRREVDPAAEFREVRRALNERIGVNTISEATEQQLAVGVAWLEVECDLLADEKRERLEREAAAMADREAIAAEVVF